VTKSPGGGGYLVELVSQYCWRLAPEEIGRNFLQRLTPAHTSVTQMCVTIRSQCIAKSQKPLIGGSKMKYETIECSVNALLVDPNIYRFLDQED